MQEQHQELEQKKQEKGFRLMTPEKHRKICSMGGKAAHKRGTAHQWTAEEAALAGRKGGLVRKNQLKKIRESA